MNIGHTPENRETDNTSKEECRKVMPVLLQALFVAALQKGHNKEELAQSLGVTPGYVFQLRSGLRLSNRISMSFARRCADYLGVSTLGVLVLAEVFDIRDFAWPNHTDTNSQRTMAIQLLTEAMKENPEFRCATIEEQSVLMHLIVRANYQKFEFNWLPKVFLHAQRASQAMPNDEYESSSTWEMQ